MPWIETLYTRPLRRPLDGPTRQAIDAEFARRRDEIPMPAELHWHPHLPEFTVRAPLLSLIVRFTPELLRVDAELSLAARLVATRGHRRDAVRFIDTIAAELGL